MSLVCFVTQVLSTLRGSAPRARQAVSPIFLHSTRAKKPLEFHSVQTFAPLALRFATGGRYPSACACYPRLRQVAFGMYVTCHSHNTGNRKGEALMSKATAPKPNIYEIVTDRIITSLNSAIIPWEKPSQSPSY